MTDKQTFCGPPINVRALYDEAVASYRMTMQAGEVPSRAIEAWDGLVGTPAGYKKVVDQAMANIGPLPVPDVDPTTRTLNFVKANARIKELISARLRDELARIYEIVAQIEDLAIA